MLVAAIRIWLFWTFLFAGIAAAGLLTTVLVLKVSGHHVVAPLWLFPAIALWVGGLFALPGAIRAYRQRQWSQDRFSRLSETSL